MKAEGQREPPSRGVCLINAMFGYICISMSTYKSVGGSGGGMSVRGKKEGGGNAPSRQLLCVSERTQLNRVSPRIIYVLPPLSLCILQPLHCLFSLFLFQRAESRAKEAKPAAPACLNPGPVGVWDFLTARSLIP